MIGANLGAVQLLVFWSRGARGEPRSRVHSGQYLMLPAIRVGILLVAPLSNVIQPSNRIACIIGRKSFGVGIVAVVIRAECRIPQSTLVALVLEEPGRKVEPWYCVVMGSVSHLNHTE